VPARFMLGKLLFPFIVPDDRRAVRSLLGDVQRHAVVRTFTVRIEPRHAAQVWVEMRIGGHYDPVENTHRIRWLLRDVTDRIKLEQELSDLHVSVDLRSALSEVNRLIESERNALSSLLARLGAAAAIPNAQVYAGAPNPEPQAPDDRRGDRREVLRHWRAAAPLTSALRGRPGGPGRCPPLLAVRRDP